MASPASFIRSAAQGTSSAYRRLPIRWRLAGGSAVLTLVILCGFAAIVGVLTTRQIRSDFNEQINQTADRLRGEVIVQDLGDGSVRCGGYDLNVFGSADNARIRILNLDGVELCKTRRAPDLGFPQIGGYQFKDYRVAGRLVRVRPLGTAVLQYARPISDVQVTLSKVRFFLIFGVLGGAALALLAGLAVARRAMRPIAEMTGAAREIERTRDPSLSLPHPEADDEIAELARTLEGMLHALDDARTETEAMLDRQRAFVADASHELRTPLTSVLANLELLSDHLDGDLRESADSALRSSRRMRRLVADLLLLARADAGRVGVREPTDVAEVLTEAAGELGPVMGDHELTIAADHVVVDGARDDLFRLAINLIENAVRHTPEGTQIRASVTDWDGTCVLVVQDEGPGVPDDLAPTVFDRFVRGGGDRAGSSGLGLSIVRAVAESHGGSVRLERGAGGRGARFVVELPAAQVPVAAVEA